MRYQCVTKIKAIMNQLIALVLSVFLCINSSFALSNEDIPDEFSITEHWISLTTSFDIETKTEKLGTLYRKFFSLLLTYELFDPLNHKLATAKSKFFSLTAHFDVYDNNNILIGIAEERLFAFFPTFDIYAKNATTKLARAKMNFWGTTFTIYDTVTDNEIATMHRSFFRFKNDWDFKITNKELFSQRSIDPRVLMTVIAFQGDREYWERDRNNNSSTASKTVINSSTALTQQLNVLLKKIDVISKQEQLRTIKNY